jgi:hypothetical protein
LTKVARKSVAHSAFDCRASNLGQTGYLLVYSQAVGSKRKKTLVKRIAALKCALSGKGWTVLKYTVRPKKAEADEQDKIWAWSMCLLRQG